MQTQREYYRLREQVERTAAEKASSEAARRVHLQLAQHYAERADEGEEVAVPNPRPEI